MKLEEERDVLIERQRYILVESGRNGTYIGRLDGWSLVVQKYENEVREEVQKSICGYIFIF